MNSPSPRESTSSQASLSSSGDSATRALLCAVEPLSTKPARLEVRAGKDLRRFADTACIALDIPASPLEAVNELLDSLVSSNLLTHESLPDARRAICAIRQDTSDETGKKDLFAHWQRNIAGAGFIVAFGTLSALDDDERRIVALGRLSTPGHMGVVGESGLTRYVVLVLGPACEVKEVKTPFEVARSFAAMLQDETFRASFRRAHTDDDVREAIRTYVAEDDSEVDIESGVPTVPEDETFRRTGRFAGGLVDDIRRRYNPRMYASDWTDGILDPRSLLKYLSTVVWLYFAIIMPTIAFGALDNDNTKGSIGVVETIISQAFSGLVFATLAGQPLTIVMTTAPLTVFIDVLFRWCASLKIDFLPFYAWTGFWTAFFLILLVVTDACSIMKYCGHFTEEIFAMLIAALFIGEYVKPLIYVAKSNPPNVFLLAFLLATGTYFIANCLLVFRRSFLLKPLIRQILSDFGVPIAILVMSGVRLAFPGIPAEMLKVPEKIGIVTTSGRSWLVPVFTLPVKYIFLASVSGILLATLFFLDQNISSILVNRRENKLRKGPGYNLDLVVVSIIIVVQSLLGLPWTHAALPHSPLHARQLADVEEYEAHGRRYERVIKARETRWTGFLTHILIGLSILMRDALKNIPLAVLWGFFLFLGIGTLDGNALWDRVLLFFTQPEKYPPNHYVRRVPVRRIHLYTAIQLALLVLLWLDKSNFYIGDTVFNTGLLFPFIIASFIPIRLYILPRIFKQSELDALSKEGDDEINISDTGVNV